MKRKKLLIVARPDQSLQIYDSLREQSCITYTFLTFKVVRPWVKTLLGGWNKLVCVGKDAVISWRCTFLNICRYSLRWNYAQRWSEENIMEANVRHLFKKNDYKIIHYWPIYCYHCVEKWAKEHPGALVIADVHFPNPEATIHEMEPVYQHYGLKQDNTNLLRHLDIIKRILYGAPSLMVPSQYVADSYREMFPNKPFYIVSYGISVSPTYHIQKRQSVKRFVFAGGTISLEKGCDLLCEYFSNHPDMELHLYGSCPPEQRFIFEPYMNIANIFFHGHTAKAELQNHIVRYDVGIHLSRYDAYSLSVGEIIGCGLPVVISRNTGNSDDVIQYGWGEVTDLDEKSIDIAIKHICNQELYDEYINHIDSYIKNNHKPYGQKMIEFYQKYLE